MARAGRKRDAGELSPAMYTVLRAIADAEDAGLPLPTLAAMADAIRADGIASGTRGMAKHAFLCLSDRRLIDGYGTARRLTEAGWETLETAGVA